MHTRWFRRPKAARPKNLWRRLGRLAKLIYVRVVRVHGAPREVAAGVAVGVWLGIVPTFGLAVPLAYLLAWVFRFNKAGALAGAMVMNPLTTPFFWAASAALGAWFTGLDWRVVYHQVRGESYGLAFGRSAYVYFAGNLVLATAAAAFAYVAAYLAARARRERRRRKKALAERAESEI